MRVGGIYHSSFAFFGRPYFGEGSKINIVLYKSKWSVASDDIAPSASNAFDYLLATGKYVKDSTDSFENAGTVYFHRGDSGGPF